MRLLDKESDLESKKKTRFCGTANPVNFHLLCIFSLYRCVNLLGARIPRKDIVKAINYIKYMKTHTHKLYSQTPSQFPAIIAAVNIS